LATNGKIAFVGDLQPDDPNKAAKPAPKQPIPALSAQDRVIIAKSAEEGAVRLTCAIIAAPYKDGNPQQLEEIAGSMTERLAARLERDIKRRLGA
jgi:hypothetical protein